MTTAIKRLSSEILEKVLLEATKARSPSAREEAAIWLLRWIDELETGLSNAEALLAIRLVSKAFLASS